MRRFDEGIVEMQRALMLDPASLIINADLAWMFGCAGLFDRAIEQSRKALDLDPNSAYALATLGYAASYKGMHSEAIAAFEKEVAVLGRDAWALPDLAVGLGMAGRREEALRVIAELTEKSKGTPVPAYYFGLAYVGLGHRDPEYQAKAVEQFEKAYEERTPLLAYFVNSRFFDFLRSNQRFTALLARMGFPESGPGGSAGSSRSF